MKITSSKTIAQTVADKLRRAILSGELPGGEKLIEQKLAAQYGASRIPIREAIRHLEMEGYVERVNYTSTYVKKISLSDFNELNKLFSLFANFLLPQAIPNYTKETYISLKKSVIKISNAPTYEEWCLCILKLIDQMYTPANNPYSTKIIKDLNFNHLRLAYKFFSGEGNEQKYSSELLKVFITLCEEGRIEEAIQNRLDFITQIGNMLRKHLEDGK